MSVEEIHIGDIGTVFRCSVCDNTSTIINLSSYTSLYLIFQKPDGSTITKDASLYTDGTDGIITYTTVAGDLDLAGIWRMQAYIILSSGSWKSNIVKFTVYENL